MRITVAALPAFGHLYPMVPFALAAARAGHEVTIAVGSPFADRLPLPSVDPIGRPVPLAQVERLTAERHPTLKELDFAVALFADVAAGLQIDGLLAHWSRHRPDIVVYDAGNVGAGVAAHLLDIPAAAFSVSSWLPFGPLVALAAIRYQGHRWTARGRPPPADGQLQSAVIDPFPALWPSPPAPTGVPAAVRWPIRSTAWSESDLVPPWLRRPADRPRAYPTLGTVSYGALAAFRRALIETAEQGVQVLAAIGEQGDPSALGPLPPLVSLERFVDQGAVLTMVDLAVHHGGSGTTLAGLAAGLPQLLLPQGADQFLNAEMLSSVGAALVVGNDQPDGSVGAAVRQLLDPGSTVRAVARLAATQIAQLPSPAAVVDRLVAELPARSGATDPART